MEDPEYDLEEWNLLHSVMDRQDVDIGNPLVVAALAGGLAILAFQLLLPLLAPLLRLSGSNPSSLERLSVPLLPPVSMLGLPALAVTREERPRLENHPKCGTTTGGQEECWWDCEVIDIRSYDFWTGKTWVNTIANPECLEDCFLANQDIGVGNSTCFAELIKDVTTKGTCAWNNQDNPASFLLAEHGIDIWGWSELGNNCTIGNRPEYRQSTTTSTPTPLRPEPVLEIVKGTCSDETETLLKTTDCLESFAEQPTLIKDFLHLLLKFSCTGELYFSMIPSFEEFGDTASARLAPVSSVDLEAGTKTELNYNNTRHRYPWICSLRTKGITAEHLCALTLLSVPPQPTIIVGPAHCTYLCKDGDARGARLEACCCTPGPLGCSEDTIRCGKNPGAAEMEPKEVIILCGEWETGPAPRESSGEKYNEPLEVIEIVRHPEFDAGGLGVEGGSDLAVFRTNPQSVANLSALNINPVCLPDPTRPKPTEGVQSGWSNPPPLHYFRDFGPGFLSFVTDTFKQWHYKLKIEEDCREANRSGQVYSQFYGHDIVHPSKAYYPPGLVCAKELSSQFCPNTGDSGSPLMVKDSLGRYSIEGVLSFLKGCETFSMGARNKEKTKFEFVSYTESPLAYTKLSCYLPWVAEQFGLSYDDQSADDKACVKGSGQKPPFNSTHQYDTVCREVRGKWVNWWEGHWQLDAGPPELLPERPCIFPFYYKEKLYDSCALLETSNFIVPVWRCPTRNITTKYEGTDISHFTEDIELNKEYCINGGQLDPNRTCYDIYKYPAFSTCKSDCPGVRGYGIIGGGAVLFTASALAGQAILPMLGIGTAASVIGGGAVVSRAMCMAPFCRARSGQCCILIATRRGVRCPRSC